MVGFEGRQRIYDPYDFGIKLSLSFGLDEGRR